MSADTAQDRSALRWVRPEIEESLRQVRRSLEDFAEGDGDQALIVDCAEQLHRIRGTLQVVQVFGAAMLVDELEQVARVMGTGAVGRKEEAAEVLMMGLVQLPSYLEKVERGQPDIPIILLPLMNDLRAVRDAPLVSEISLFAPKLDQVIEADHVNPGSGNPDMVALVKKRRPHYHRGLLHWFRGVGGNDGLRLIREVIGSISAQCGVSRTRRLLDAAEAMVVGLEEGTLEVGVANKLLFGRLDRYFKSIIERGEEEAARDFPTDLLKNILYYVARSASTSPVVESVRQSADLANTFPVLDPDDQAFGGHDQDLLSAVAGAIGEDLNKAKDDLDLYMRGDRNQLEQLVDLGEPLRRIGDTLGMVGRGDLRERLKDRHDELEKLVDGSQVPDDEYLMGLAGDILQVESALDDLSGGSPFAEEDAAIGVSGGELHTPVRAAIEESFVELAKIKDALTKYFDHPDDLAQLKRVADRLHGVAGSMRVLDEGRAGDLLDDLGGYVAELEQGQRDAPDAAARDAFADLITSVEFYMEVVLGERGGRQEILDYAGQAASTLFGETETLLDLDDEQEDESSGEIAASASLETDDTLEVSEQDLEPEPTPAPTPEPVASADKPSLEDVDPEILEIFLEEAKEELENIQELYPRWRKDHDDTNSLTTFRRSFHTLKGSGRLVGAKTIGEFAWAIENLLNRVLDGTAVVSGTLLELMDDAVDALPALVDAQEHGTAPSIDVSPIEERAHQLADPNFEPESQLQGEESEDDAAGVLEQAGELEAGEEIVVEAPQPEAEDADEQEPDSPMADAEPEPAAPMDVSMLDLVEPELVLEVEELASAPEVESIAAPEAEVESEAEPQVDEPVQAAGVHEEDAASADDSEAAEPQPSEPAPLQIDATLLDIFRNESDGHLATISDFVESNRGRPGGAEISDDLCRALHTLRGSAHMAEIHPIAEVAAEYETFFNHLREFEQRSDARSIDLLEQLVNVSRTILAGINVPGATLPDTRQLVIGVRKLTGDLLLESQSQLVDEESVEAEEESLDGDSGVITVPLDDLDDELIEVFLEEARELIDQLEKQYNDWSGAPGNEEHLNALQRTLHTLKGGARLSGLSSMGDVAHALESNFEAISVGRIQPNDGLVTLARAAVDKIAGDTDRLQSGLPLTFAPKLVDRLEAAARGEEWATADSSESTLEVDSELISDFAAGARFSDEDAALAAAGDLDDFSEPMNSAAAERNSTEAVASTDVEAPVEDDGVAAPDASPDDAASAMDEAPRVDGDSISQLLDGDSLDAVGADTEPTESLSQDSESLLLDTSDKESILLAADDSALLADSQLLTDSELLGDSSELHPSSGVQLPPDTPTTLDAESAVVDSRIIQFPGTAEREGDLPRRTPPPEPESEKPTPAELIRVRSDLLDQIVNNAGEVSIYRARLEQQNSALGFNLQELRSTIERLREQLRKLDVETEAQILSRYEREGEEAGREEFDPLELDRFSTMQQLSRALVETVNDLLNIGETMDDMSRDTDTLLLQQSRVSNDLQDGLLRTRMVPFSNRIARLQRVVRQTSQSLGKRAELQVQGGEGELDRTILDRIMGPLEHLLRNSVAHGIEMPEQRAQSGKPEEGRVTIYLTREGGDVVLVVSDDGTGLDREAIRAKAIERELLQDGVEVTEDELYRFILEHGFSTVEQVNQIAGRGVGMDVVLSEIKQLGGSLEIDSQVGRGSSFTIRLPFTLAITQALMVTLGDDVFAVPHTSIDGVIRVSRDDLRECYEGIRDGVEYAGRTYVARYLGIMLGMEMAPSLPDTERWFPLLLVRSGENRVAIHVDSLLGNRQIVIKTLGAQLSTLRAISGGTILADGRVALILDTANLVRMDALQQTTAARQAVSEEEAKGVTVMVVDDSITVRKVTSRLLERHNMNVITAKDGMDAVAMLQEQVPDVMLLDIEMPRMDGFELARHMQNTEDLAEVPIIMITSRTGEKHRTRAMELGVKRYLGKPYQEAELLENIYTVLAELPV